MRRNVLLIGAILTAATLGRADEYLVSLPVSNYQALPGFMNQGIRVLTLLDGSCLALISADQFSSLPAGWQVLDVNPAEQNYYIITARDPIDCAALAQYGTILLQLPAAHRGRHPEPLVLLRTTEEQLPELNRLPVQLCRLSMEPIVLAPDDAPNLIEPRPVSDSLISRIVNNVSEDSVLASIRRLQNFYTRYSTTDSCRAAIAWVQERLRSYNCDTVYSHLFRSNYAPNAVGIKFGRENPRRSYIICGHVDNTSDQQPNRCPGADDNASGTTAVLEACRVFADYEFDYTVQFIGFSGEEQGLYGSDSFSAQAYRRHDTILGVFNFDMISYGRQNRDSVLIIGRSTGPNCTELVNAFCAAADTYTQLKYIKQLISSGGYGSDHYYFWQRGYLALWGEEDDFTPMYHTIGDTIGALYARYVGTNNVPMCTQTIKAAVATIAKLAGVRELSGAQEPAHDWKNPHLTQNAPNPFRKSTVIHYSIPGAQPSRLTIYDRQGRSCRSFTLPAQRSGSVIWDGKNDAGEPVGPGIYFYRLESTPANAVYKAVRLAD